jgi:hypothetical protein
MGEEEEIDLMRILVLHNPPAETAGAQPPATTQLRDGFCARA